MFESVLAWVWGMGVTSMLMEAMTTGVEEEQKPGEVAISVGKEGVCCWNICSLWGAMDLWSAEVNLQIKT